LTPEASFGSICCQVADLLHLSRESPAVVFVNPHAGGGLRRSRLARVKALLSARAFPVEYVFTESRKEMESRVRTAIAAGHTVLLAMGGDGTLHALVNAAYGSEVVLGVLPAGGGNDFAAHLGLPKNLMAAAAAIPSAQPRCLDVLRARTADGRERLYLGGGGLGLDADSAHYVGGAYARLPGRLRYIAAALRALREFQPLHVRAEFPGSKIPAMDAQVFVAGVLNTRSYGAGVRFAPDARIDDGLLTTLFVKHLSAWQVVGAVPRLLACGDLPDSYVERVSASCVRLTADRECLFHGDGEILGPAPVEVEVLPRAVRVLAP
jgi:diacylglycerol kinase (ATP)